MEFFTENGPQRRPAERPARRPCGGSLVPKALRDGQVLGVLGQGGLERVEIGAEPRRLGGEAVRALPEEHDEGAQERRVRDARLRPAEERAAAPLEQVAEGGPDVVVPALLRRLGVRAGQLCPTQFRGNDFLENERIERTRVEVQCNIANGAFLHISRVPGRQVVLVCQVASYSLALPPAKHQG